jgi:hypothetical protein
MPDPSLAFDADLCALALAAYATPATFIAAGDVHAVVTQRLGTTVIAFRGTVPTSWEDWFRDFAAWPDRVTNHTSLGRCHDGFITGAEAILQQLRGILSPSRPFALTGHSLGGALAIATGALLVDCGLVPTRLTTFGAPRVGMSLTGILARVEGRRFRHGDDPVPEVPSWPYQNDRSWTRIGEPTVNPIDDHMIAGYLAALVPAPVSA